MNDEPSFQGRAGCGRSAVDGGARCRSLRSLRGVVAGANERGAEMEMEEEMGCKMGMKGGIREHLTRGPLTLLSLSLRIRSLSLRALSLRES